MYSSHTHNDTSMRTHAMQACPLPPPQNGRTGLHAAAYKGHAPVVAALLASGADTKARDVSGNRGVEGNGGAQEGSPALAGDYAIAGAGCTVSSKLQE